MVSPLFLDPVDGAFPHVNAYSLITLLRGLEYPSTLYDAAWREIEGCNSVTRVVDNTNFPPPYAVAYHDDGVVFATAGLQNFRQGLEMYFDSDSVPYSTLTGRIMQGAVLWWLQIRSDVLNKIANAPNDYRIVCTGHSMGGIVAMLAAAEMAALYGVDKIVNAISFGSPKGAEYPFVNALEFPAFAVANWNDTIPLWPSADSINYLAPGLDAVAPYRFATVGRLVNFQDDGTITYARTRVNAFAGQLGTLTDLIVHAGATSRSHGCPYYSTIVGKKVRRVHVDSREVKLYQLYRAMNFNVAPADFSIPLDPPHTTAITSPNLPTRAELQRIPPAPITPANVDTVVYDHTFIAATQRMTAEATARSSNTSTVDTRLAGRDLELVRGTRQALYAIARRDGRLATARTRSSVGSPRQLITNALLHLDRIAARDARVTAASPGLPYGDRAYLVDPRDTETVDAIAVYRGVLEDRRDNPQPARTPILNRSVTEQALAEFHLQAYFEFFLS